LPEKKKTDFFFWNFGVCFKQGERVVYDRENVGLGTIVPEARKEVEYSHAQPTPKKRKRRGGGKIGGKKKLKQTIYGGKIDEQLSEEDNDSERDSDDELVEKILAATPNVKKPMMECELHDGEKIMVSLHHNVSCCCFVENYWGKKRKSKKVLTCFVFYFSLAMLFGNALWQCKTLEYQELPSSAADRPENAKNARAAAAFVDGQIKAGVVELVPGARKDVEYTMNCCQIFHVFRCKAKALQIEIDGNSTMASPGDMFMVPSDTTYQLINHSKKQTALIYYTIVDYVDDQQGDQQGDQSGGQQEDDQQEEQVGEEEE